MFTDWWNIVRINIGNNEDSIFKVYYCIFVHFTTIYFGYNNTLLFKVKAEISDMVRSISTTNGKHAQLQLNLVHYSVIITNRAGSPVYINNVILD